MPLNPLRLGGHLMSKKQNNCISISDATKDLSGSVFADINQEHIDGPLQSLLPTTLKVVNETSLEPLWDQLVRKFHYLGFQKLLGHRLKYLAFSQDRPVAALSWSAPALKLRVRDSYIGWSDDQRKAHLHRLASNSRFLILPWVSVKNLASHILSLNLRRLNQDWKLRYGHSLWLVETFVDPTRFKGTCYRAANWIFAGHTYGSGKKGQGYVYHGSIKEVYLYVLESRVRTFIGCESKPYFPFHRPPQWSIKMGELKMQLRHADWHPDIVPCMKLSEKEVDSLADEAVSFHSLFDDCFWRKEQRRLGLAYLSGLISNVKSKSVEPIALEFLGSTSVRSSQRFLKTYRWHDEEMLDKNQSLLALEIASPEGMLTVDSSEFVKKGKESVGVARQYCGALGKVENCQSGVFIGYASEKGYGLLDGQLYLPESWLSKEQEKRRQDNKVPDDVTFQTKPQIALNLINRVCSKDQFPIKWVGCDSTFGSDWNFLESLPEGSFYFAQVRANTKVFVKKPKVEIPPYKGRGARPKKEQILEGEPQPKTVDEIALSRRSWKTVVLAEGSKGPILAEVALLRVFPSKDGLPRENSVWLFMRRFSDGQIKFAFSNAPRKMPLSELMKASTMRWSIEQSFKEGKDQLGMDHYEHRSWPAWHRHMTYVFLAMHFLLRVRIRFKKKSPALTLAQARFLVAAVLPLRSLNKKEAIEIIKYHTYRNHVAYKSHRKKRLELLENLKIEMSL